MNAPVEPFADALRALMLGLGTLLIACFAAPWSVSDGAEFSWDVLRNAEATYPRLIALLMVASGLSALLLAILPAATIGRGLAAACLGTLSLIASEASDPQGAWWIFSWLLGMAALVAGLLLRSQYRSSLVARLIVTAGALALIVPWLVPIDGDPRIAVVLSNLGSDISLGAKLSGLVQLGVLALAGVALFAWLPAPSSAAAGVLAWIVVAVIPIVTLADLLASSDIATRISRNLGATILVPLSTAAWIALGGWGVATLVGKSLESS